ncbi:MAG: biotin/lipoyl-binding protein [Bacteroidales bacterium]|nr:biotin/lipoyl-binding protein [Bacteroidales bacterium]MBQ7467992.1 biotin/lipoyl-binding protein [Bacteroidales bacterium]MBQ8461133.1 biotin/lipoyl-binding protein [Bacteroidales bacterium]MCR5364091.1 biotin/lipoyl-binding protein [Bacteroidales bacterium]MDT3360459.1 biotin/lipoyl-binding protein [Bacteroidota bacterium]
MSNYKFKISGKEYNVTIGSIEDKIAKVNVNGKDYEVELENQPAAAPAVAAAPVAAAAQAAPAAAAAPAAKPAAGAGVKVTSPLPGVIIEVSVKEGQAVKAGQKVAVIEAMKMENEIAATQDGTISAIHVNKGDSVLEGADIVSIA